MVISTDLSLVLYTIVYPALLWIVALEDTLVVGKSILYALQNFIHLLDFPCKVFP